MNDDNNKAQVTKSTNDQKNDKVYLMIDQDVCIRCGSCHITYPDYFEGRDDGSSHPIAGVQVDKAVAIDLKLICPVEAIDISETKPE